MHRTRVIPVTPRELTELIQRASAAGWAAATMQHRTDNQAATEWKHKDAQLRDLADELRGRIAR